MSHPTVVPVVGRTIASTDGKVIAYRDNFKDTVVMIEYTVTFTDGAVWRFATPDADGGLYDADEVRDAECCDVPVAHGDHIYLSDHDHSAVAGPTATAAPLVATIDAAHTNDRMEAMAATVAAITGDDPATLGMLRHAVAVAVERVASAQLVAALSEAHADGELVEADVTAEPVQVRFESAVDADGLIFDLWPTVVLADGTTVSPCDEYDPHGALIADAVYNFQPTALGDELVVDLGTGTVRVQ